MRFVYLVDNSASRRVRTNPEVEHAFLRLLDEGSLGSCLPQLLEQGYSARNLAEHDAIVTDNLYGKVFLAPLPQIAEIAIGLQRKLFAAHRGRDVGVSDLQIAATALCHSDDRQLVTVVHYDRDFDALAAVEPRLSTRWIVPRGSAD